MHLKGASGLFILAFPLCFGRFSQLVVTATRESEIGEPLLPDLPNDALREIGDHLSGRDRVSFRLARKSWRDRLGNDIMSLYFQIKTGATRTSAIALYRFCIENQNDLVPKHFTDLMNCFDAVDQVELAPSAAVRLQLAYRLIDEEVVDDLLIGNAMLMASGDLYLRKLLRGKGVLKTLMASTQWSEAQRSALLHHAATKCRTNAATEIHPLFSELHRQFCGIEGPSKLTGSCFSSLITFFPKAIPWMNMVDVLVIDPQRWNEEKNRRQTIVNMFISKPGGRIVQESVLIEALSGFLHDGGDVNLLNRHLQKHLFSSHRGYGKALLSTLIQAGLDVRSLTNLWLMLVQAHMPVDLGVADLMLTAGADINFYRNDYGVWAPPKRQYFEAIPIDILALIQSYVGSSSSPLIGVYASISVQRAKSLLEAGLTTVNALDDIGRSSLFFKISDEVARYILDQGLDIDTVDFNGERVIFYRMVWMPDTVTGHLLATGSVKINERDNLGLTLLQSLPLFLEYHESKNSGLPATRSLEDLASLLRFIERLLAMGADPHIKDNSRKTTLDHMMEYWNERFADMNPQGDHVGVKLVRHGISLLAKAMGVTVTFDQS